MGGLGGLFPRVFRVVSNRESSFRECYELRGNDISWVVSFRRTLCQLEEV